MAFLIVPIMPSNSILHFGKFEVSRICTLLLIKKWFPSLYFNQNHYDLGSRICVSSPMVEFSSK